MFKYVAYLLSGEKIRQLYIERFLKNLTSETSIHTCSNCTIHWSFTNVSYIEIGWYFHIIPVFFSKWINTETEIMIYKSCLEIKIKQVGWARQDFNKGNQQKHHVNLLIY